MPKATWEQLSAAPVCRAEPNSCGGYRSQEPDASKCWRLAGGCRGARASVESAWNYTRYRCNYACIYVIVNCLNNSLKLQLLDVCAAWGIRLATGLAMRGPQPPPAPAARSDQCYETKNQMFQTSVLLNGFFFHSFIHTMNCAQVLQFNS